MPTRRVWAVRILNTSGCYTGTLLGWILQQVQANGNMTMNNGSMSGPAHSHESTGGGRLLGPTCFTLLTYLWTQRCCCTESEPACRGPDTPLLCFCSCLRHSVPPWLRASRLYIRWKMLREVFRTGPTRPGAEKPRFGFGWTQIKKSPPGPSQNLPEPPRRRTRLSNCQALGDDVTRHNAPNSDLVEFI